MTDKDEIKKAIKTLKDYCYRYRLVYSDPCKGCVFEDCCQNRWSDYDTLAQCMDGLMEDITTAEKVENTDFGAAYDAVVSSICSNFEECKGCPFYNQEDDCPRGQLEYQVQKHG